MDWTDRAIVLGARRQGEGSLIVSLLTERHGRHKGLARGGAKSRQRGIFEPGNAVTASWRARLEDHLGHVSLEPVAAHAAAVLDDPVRLACLEAATSLADAALPERAPYPALYRALAQLMAALAEDDGWAPAHLGWERMLLAELGYGLDLAACAVTGATEGLGYVSPRTGRAVSTAAAGDYQDRLLILPRLFGGTGRADDASPGRDLLDGLALTGHFLDRHLFQPHGAGLPPARGRYVDRVARLMAA
jgi:DNA repair protein RecO (recombination protein O)